MADLNKIVILVDSFKGSITSKEISKIGVNYFKKTIPNIIVEARSIADGGEGTVSFFIDELGYEEVLVESVNAYLEPITTRYAKKGDQAVFDVASIVGFDANHDKLDILKATTYGIGLVLKQIINDGYKKIYLGLGGSITNDGGSGILEAMGAKFYYDNQLIEIHKTPFEAVNKVDLKPVMELFKDVSLTALCDVTNPLLGPLGATQIFSPQKGSTVETRKIMESWMKLYAEAFNISSEAPGCGAAGGIGFMVNAIGGMLSKGIEVMLNEIGLVSMLDKNTLLITGEGALDKTSFGGKVVGKLVSLTEKYQNKLAIMCGIDNFHESKYKVYPLHDTLVPNYKETVKEDIFDAYKKILKDNINNFGTIKIEASNSIYSDLKALREKVFVVEQNVDKELEFDELDKDARHLVLKFNDKVIAGGRITALDGMAKIGRVVVDKDYRGLGIGLEVMKALISESYNLGYKDIIVYAQTRALGFYQKLGFVAFGEEFEEANIPHYQMKLSK